MNVLMSYTTGLTLYFIVIDGDGNIWNGSSFLPYDELEWDNYAVPLTETSPATYQGDFPVTIPTLGIYSLVGYLQTGATPDFNDNAISWGSLTWDGFVEAPGGFGCLIEEFNLTVGIPNSISVQLGQGGGIPVESVVTSEGNNTNDDTIAVSEDSLAGETTITVGEEKTQNEVSITAGVR